MLVLLPGLELDVGALDHLLEHLDLTVLLFYPRLVLGVLLLPQLLMSLLENALLIGQLLVPTDQLSNILQAVLHLDAELLVFLRQGAHRFLIGGILHL